MSEGLITRRSSTSSGSTIHTSGFPESSDINFYDYDGTLLYGFTFNQIRNMLELPESRPHEGLRFDGWNWSLTDLQELTMPMDVGALYSAESDDCILEADIYTSSTTNSLGFKFMRVDDSAESIVVQCEIDGEIKTSYNKTVATANVSTNMTIQNISPIGYHKIRFITSSEAAKIKMNGSSGTSSMALSVSSNIIKKIKIGRKMTSLGNYFLNNNAVSIDNIPIPNSIEEIGNFCLNVTNGTNGYAGTRFSYLVFPNNCKIGSNVRGSSADMKGFSLPKVFSGIQGTTEYVSGVIPTSFMTYASYVKRLCIPSSCTAILSTPFHSSNIQELYMHSVTPPTFPSDSFKNSNVSTKIYVPAGSLDLYKNAAGWSSYADQIYAYE